MASNNIIDGKLHANKLLQKLAKEVSQFKSTHNIIPKLVVVLMGQDPASILYVRNKILQAQSIGMLSIVINIASNALEQELLTKLHELNTDPSVHGIIVQLPLPSHINKSLILTSIDPAKDVDGFHPLNVGRLYTGDYTGFVPCTPLGCIHLLKEYIDDLSGMHAVILGRSHIVGRPVAELLVRENCTVTICHSHTSNLQALTKQSDIVISAMGKPCFLTAEYFKPSAVVLDVGVNMIQNGTKVQFVGDVDFVHVVSKVAFITPVPGGIGPMTVAYLLSNTLRSATNMIN